MKVWNHESSVESWNPFTEVDGYQMLLRSAQRFLPTRADRSPGTAPAQEPARFQAVEDERQLLIRAWLPGIRREDVHVVCSRGIVTVVGERQMSAPSPSPDTAPAPVRYRSLIHQFAVRGAATPAAVDVDFADGWLRVRVTKSGAVRGADTREG